MTAPDTPQLRRAVLAVCVLDDIDLEPYGEGVVLRAGPPVEVTWLELRRVLAGADPLGELARRRLRRHLRGRRLAADLGLGRLAAAVRPVGFAVDDPMHPGVDWVSRRVLGGVLDVGLGFVDVGTDPDAVVLLPPAGLEAAGLSPQALAGWAEQAEGYLERMGAVAAERLRSSGNSTLRPIGDCDVVTLLASATLRGALTAGEVGGLRAAAVPMRRRGWLDLRAIDPAFAPAAAAATDLEERGFPRPLLLTADEVVLAADGGRPAEISLRDPAVSTPRAPSWRS